MSSLTAPIDTSAPPGATHDAHRTLPSSTSPSLDTKQATLMHDILKEKKILHDTALTWNTKRIAHDGFSYITGDILTALFAGMEIIFSINKLLKFLSTAQLEVFKCVMFVAGFIGGFINIAAGLFTVKLSIAAFIKKDYAVGFRLLIGGFASIMIGLVMVLSGLGLTVFFTTHAWIFPTLFFIASILPFRETLSRSMKIHKNDDFISKFKVRDLYKDDTNNTNKAVTDAVKDYIGKPPQDDRDSGDMPQKRHLSAKLDEMENKLGFYTANLLFESVANSLGEETDKTVTYEGKTIKAESKDWDKVQYIRFFLRILFITGFIISMIGLMLCPIGAITCSIVASLAIIIGRGFIGVYLNLFKPFTRSSFISIPSVMSDEKSAASKS